MQKRKAVLTVDLEDYRRQQLRDEANVDGPGNPAEVGRQFTILLQLFEECDARATCFTVGRLARELPGTLFRSLTKRHRLACHGDQHAFVHALGPKKFRGDLERAKKSLEDISGEAVLSYRAPYFSSDPCDPWFGESLLQKGFKIDSSRRVNNPPPGFKGTMPLPGTGNEVLEVPLAAMGFGPKRLTIIGGTYFRILPLPIILRLLKKVEARGFLPMIYLHPYDIDPSAAPLDYPKNGFYLKARMGDWLRDRGRNSVRAKLLHLSTIYEFDSIEALCLS